MIVTKFLIRSLETTYARLLWLFLRFCWFTRFVWFPGFIWFSLIAIIGLDRVNFKDLICV